MRVLKIGITGADDFLGKHILMALKLKKGVAVSGCSIFDTFNLLRMKKFVGGKDVIIHAAAAHRGENKRLIEGNIISADNIVSAIKSSKKRPKIIFISSTQVESDSIYGQTKKIAEAIFGEYSIEERAPVSILRVANEFGEGAKPFYNSVIATFCYQLANGKKLSVNPAQKKFNFVYSGDIARLVTKEALKKGKGLKIEVVKSANEITIPQLAKILGSFSSDKRPKLKSKFYRNLHKTYLSYLSK